MYASDPARPEVIHGTLGDHVGGYFDPLLTSSLAPRRLSFTPVIRTRLLDRLSHGVREKPLTLLSAPAGSGKTVLAGSWMDTQSVPWPIAWLTVDEANDDPTQFWAYVMESFARADVDIGFLDRPRRGGAVPPSFFIRLAARLIELSEPVVLILDCTRHLSVDGILAGLDFLMRRASPRFRLVLCTRADPQLPLHNYRLTDSMVELRFDSLAFTVNEAHELLVSLGVTASRTVAASLTARTEGWAAGLRLAAASLKQGADPEQLVASLVEDGGNVAEYLFAEVLNAQPPELREFLLKTSVSADLSPDLVDLLTDRHDGRRTLAALAHANAFVEPSARSPDRYRMHSLFREMLRAQLGYESAQDVPELERRCAGWFAAQGNHHAAIEHAVASRDWNYAISMLIDIFVVGSMLAHDSCPYSSVLRSMPAELPGAEAALLRAARAFAQDERIAPADVDTVAEVAEDPTKGLPVRVSAAVVRAAITAADDPDGTRALHAADAAARLIGELSSDNGAGQPELVAIVEVARATALLHTAPAETAETALGVALAASKAAGSGPLQAKCLGGLALLEALRGGLRRATELGNAAEELASERGTDRDVHPAMTPLALAWVRAEEYDHLEARRLSARAQEGADTYEGRAMQPLVAALQARLQRSQHDFEAAHRSLAPHMADDDAPAWLRERVLIEAAHLHLAQTRPDLAVARVDALPDPHTPRAEVVRTMAVAFGARSEFAPRDITKDVDVPLDAEIDAWVASGCVQLARGDAARAAMDVDHALRLARPERIRRPFLDSTPRLRKLLRTNHELSKAAAWLSVTQATSADSPGEPPHPRTEAQDVSSDVVFVEPLSERETEVLRLLAELMSTEEIGAAMFVSVNTVRTHIRSILRKLAVRRRNAAVRRARELGII